MKLRTIAELNFRKAKKQLRPLLSSLPKHKRRHSIRVGKGLHKAGAPDVGIYGGLLHDYLERGGDVSALKDHLSELGLPPKAIKIVHGLSDAEKGENEVGNQPLLHMQQILNQTEDAGLRNILILTKMWDRIDNLRQRIKVGRLSRSYLRKSIELFEYLLGQYQGQDKALKKSVRAYKQLTQIAEEFERWALLIQ